MTQEPGARRHARDIPVDEVDLIDLVAREDVRAFEALYRAYRPRLLRFLHRMLRQQGLADEVLDDTMLVIWRKAYTYDASSKLSTWIFAIAYRQALRALRRGGKVATADGDEPEAPAESGPDGALERGQLRAQLDDSLALLSGEHRAVIELTYYQGLSCGEIAAIMGCPVATVKTRAFYARRRLRALLDATGELAL
jgi:RNA polymerase sigma-70 factor (ECF subfamily)